MVANNGDLFNAALCGFFSGALQSSITDAVGADYASTIAVGVAFATEIDSKVPTDGALVSPVDSYTMVRTNLMQSLCAGVTSGRVPISPIPSFYNVLANAVAAVYNATAASLVPGPVTPGTTQPFALFFALMPGDNAATVAVGGAVDFPQLGPTAGGGITPLGVDSFNIAVPGTYEVEWQVSVDEPGQLQLEINAVPLPNTVVGRATGTNQIIGQTVITTSVVNSVLRVINPAGNAAALTITPIAGGTHPVSATLAIKRLS